VALRLANSEGSRTRHGEAGFEACVVR